MPNSGNTKSQKNNARNLDAPKIIYLPKGEQNYVISTMPTISNIYIVLLTIEISEIIHVSYQKTNNKVCIEETPDIQVKNREAHRHTRGGVGSIWKWFNWTCGGPLPN